MTLPPPLHDPDAPAHPLPGPPPARPLALLPDGPVLESDPGAVLLTCANCGARMIERKCKVICSCGYFLSCSDYS